MDDSAWRSDRLKFAATLSLIFIASLYGCNDPSGQDAPRGGYDVLAPAAPGAGSAPREPIALAMRLAAAEPRLAAILAPRGDGWMRERNGATLVSSGLRLAEARVFNHLGARLPEHADDAIEVGLSRFARFRLRLVREGARPTEAILDSGRVVYPEVYPSTDAVLAATADSIEEVLVLRDASAPTEVHFRLELGSGLAETRLEPTGAVLFADARHDAVLRIPRPFAVDARGVRREAICAWRRGT